jgi:hypothetical protein
MNDPGDATEELQIKGAALKKPTSLNKNVDYGGLLMVNRC